MTPTPQDPVLNGQDIPSLSNVDGDRVVISGMSGMFPKSHSVKELSDILYNKINTIEPTRRFDYYHPEVVQYAGNTSGLSYFDAQFFKVHYRQSNSMDPMGRKVLEHSYQAIYDAGVNPEHLSGKKVGVYIGSCFSETEKACFYEASSRTGFGIAGCSKTMFANRISYWLNAKGPSMSIDEACCSSTAALEQAYLAISRGECEAAIVGGTFLCLHPQSSVHYGRMIQLCSDGKMKSFDQNADGCALSEAINVLFLQKASTALRVYAEVLYVKTEYISTIPGEIGPNFGFSRTIGSAVEFTKNFYENAKVSPQAVEYVEAFGCAIPDADKMELTVIEEVLCKNRKDTLFVGSVMSNIGYGEAASGISAIIKVLLGYHYGELAANMHCEQPRKDIAAIRDGRMRVVTEHQRFRCTYAAVNGISVTGVNSHVLLHGNYKPKDLHRYKTDIPYLVNISGRHEEAVNYILEILKSNPIDAEQLALLHNIHQISTAGHMGRGFVILKNNEEQKTTCLFEKTAYFDDMKRPLWFVFSGMGSQWAGMGTALLRVPIFAAAIERCRLALEPKGLDIVHIITSTDESIFNNILHSFVGIAAIQIGLTDILHAIGLKPQGIIGHSVGELGCAYADGCLTAEEMILAAYYRGLVSLETKFIHGSMAAVGMGYEQISKICPPEIEVACHNGPESSTISGPSDEMRAFVEELSKKQIFAREVPCSNIAYHSRYIADAGPGLLKYLKEVITHPKPRSERWISSSIPQDRWNEPIAKFCSAEYLTNNLLNPVLFEETSRLIPKNAALVELAPHGLLQAILKRSMPNSCVNIPLTRRKHDDNVFLLLQAIGQLYMEGYNSNLQALYPKVEMPVATGTSFLSHFVKWAHDEKWPLAMYVTADRKSSSQCKFVIALHDKEHSYLRGHSIRGNILYPFAASLILAWDTLAMMSGVPKKTLSVEFKNVNFYSQPIMHDQRQLKLHVTINRGTGWFEILEGSSKVISGFIKIWSYIPHRENDKLRNSDKYINSEDIYQLLHDRDYLYSGEFRSIECIDSSLSEADIAWHDNWVTFIDGILQLNMLRQPHNTQSVAAGVGRIKIDVQKHKLICDSSSQNDKVLLKANIFEHLQKTRCGGVTIDNIIFKNLPLDKNRMILKTTKLVPYFQAELNGHWGGEFHLQVEDTVNVCNVKLQSAQIGDYNSLEWVEAPSLTTPGVNVTIHYAEVCSNDIKKANGCKHHIDNSYGQQFSGVTESGERVMGIIYSGALSSEVRTQPELLWPVPDHWTLEEAATVPLAYMQALYCLGIKMVFQRGISVLVHEGDGPLGQAVISVLLAYNCEVFTTVSDTRKKEFLLKLFPELKAENIGYLNDDSFENVVLLSSTGGCDIVINCVKGNLRDVSCFNVLDHIVMCNQVSMKCLTVGGICCDITLIEDQDDYKFGMNHLNYERNYVTVDFSSIFDIENNKEDITVMSKMLSYGITCGYVRPLSYVTFAPREVSRAFQFLESEQQCGSVLLHLKDDTLLQEQNRYIYETENYHLILCGNLKFGVQFVNMLISRGVRKLCIHVQNETSYLKHMIRLWRNCLNVEVIMFSEKLKELKDIQSLFNSVLRLGYLEGVYITTIDDNNDMQNIINNVDFLLRELCPDIRYFAVLNIGDGLVGRDVCIGRERDQLPATMLLLPELKNITIPNLYVPENVANFIKLALYIRKLFVIIIDHFTNRGRCMAVGSPPISMGPNISMRDMSDIWRSAVHAAERAIRSPYSVLLAHTVIESEPTILQRIATIAGVTIPRDAQKSLTLGELGINDLKDGKLYLISSALQLHYNLVFDKEQIPMLTLENIQQLERTVTELPYEDKKGLATFFSYVDPDEMLATTDMVLLPTLVSSASMRGDEFEPNQKNLYIVPGMEGHHERFRVLCERLKLPAVVLQPGFDNKHETVQDVARRYVEILLKKNEIKDTFYLLGYESGVSIALETAAILEENGLTGIVYCLGCMPCDLQKEVEEQLAEYKTEEQLCDAVVSHMFSLIVCDDNSRQDIDMALSNTSSPSEKIDIGVRMLLGRVSHSAQYARALIEAALGCIEQTRNYKPSLRPLNSQLVVLKATKKSTTEQHTSLQKFSVQPVVVHDLQTPLAHCATDLRCAAIINEYLSPEILDDFSTRNLCDTYLLNAESFMGSANDID